jgi:hypothetical protein
MLESIANIVIKSVVKAQKSFTLIDRGLGRES